MLNLKGLDSLKAVGMLRLGSNKNLTDISNLRSLTFSSGDLWITQNPNLKTVHGFEGLKVIGGALFILKNENLSNIDGLSNLVSTYIIRIIDNKNLLDLNVSQTIEVKTMGNGSIFNKAKAKLLNASLSGNGKFYQN